MNVEHSATVVPLGNAGLLQVPVQNLGELIRDREDRRLGPQSARDRLAKPLSRTLKAAKLRGEPVAKIGSKIVS